MIPLGNKLIRKFFNWYILGRLVGKGPPTPRHVTPSSLEAEGFLFESGKARWEWCETSVTVHWNRIRVHHVLKVLLG